MDRGHELSAAGANRSTADRAAVDEANPDGANPERRLEAARREAIAWVLSGLMHDSRNALQQIGSCAEMLAILLTDRPDALDLVAGVEEAQVRLVRMLDDLRTYSSPLAPAYRPVDLAGLWRQVWQDLTTGGRWPRAELRQQAVPTDTRCQADPALLARALSTLLENALDATGSPATIEIACHETTLGGQAALAVAIANPGRRLSPAEQRQLFDPFFSRQGEDTGLGMAIARRLVELHGGGLHASSTASRGAEVVLTLPRRPAKKS